LSGGSYKLIRDKMVKKIEKIEWKYGRNRNIYTINEKLNEVIDAFNESQKHSLKEKNK